MRYEPRFRCQPDSITLLDISGYSYSDWLVPTEAGVAVQEAGMQVA